jgi:hypothetical protein
MVALHVESHGRYQKWTKYNSTYLINPLLLVGAEYGPDTNQ